MLTFKAQHVKLLFIYLHYFPTRALLTIIPLLRSSQQSLQELLPFFMVDDHSLTLLHFFGNVFLHIFARPVLYTSLKSLLKLICFKLLICNLLNLNLSFNHWIFYCILYALRGVCTRCFTNVFIIIIILKVWHKHICTLCTVWL